MADEFKISKPGKDIRTESILDMVLDSDNGYLSTYSGQFGRKDYTFTLNPGYPSRTNILTIPHGYNKRPDNLSLINMGYGIENRWGYIPMSIYGTSGEYFFIDGTGEDQYFEAYTDATNFYIDYVFDKNNWPATQVNVNGITFQFKYYILNQLGE